jgi:hypothetical protein
MSMSRRPAVFTQADIARAVRAGKQAGAESVKMHPDGAIEFLLKGAPLVPAPPEDAFTEWEREHEQTKAARHRKRDSEAR